MPAHSLAKVFIVEDDADDILMANTLMLRNRVLTDFTYFRDGAECIEYLSDKTKLQKGRPDLVLLDLKLPRVDGWEVLKFIKQDPDLQSIPVMMLSGSTDPDDIVNGRKLGATAYLTKPLNLGSLKTIIRHVNSLALIEESEARYFVRSTTGTR
jgi:CheY-like chemotaxis protein